MIETLDAYILSLMLRKRTFHKRAMSGVLHSSDSYSTNYSHLLPFSNQTVPSRSQERVLLTTFSFPLRSARLSTTTFPSSMDKEPLPPSLQIISRIIYLTKPHHTPRPGLASHYATVAPAHRFHQANQSEASSSN